MWEILCFGIFIYDNVGIPVLWYIYSILRYPAVYYYIDLVHFEASCGISFIRSFDIFIKNVNRHIRMPSFRIFKDTTNSIVVF